MVYSAAMAFLSLFPSPLLPSSLSLSLLSFRSIRLCRRKKRKATHQTWLVSDEGTAQKWATAINDSLQGRGLGEGEEEEEEEGVREDGVDVDNGQRQSGTGRRALRRRRLLVLINPVSGTGGSRSIWKNTLRLACWCVCVLVLAAGEGGRC